MKNVSLLLLIFFLFNCQQTTNREVAVDAEEAVDKNIEADREIEAITLLSDTLYSYSNKTGEVVEKFNLAKSNYEKDLNSADAIIWYGRRTAYLGKFQNAIKIFTEGIEKHPEDPRMYRHRGHRYLSIRQFTNAIADFEKATTLIEGTKDKVEPDGNPNPMGIPVSTLHGNIYYHLALAYYLENDLDNALRVYRDCEKVSVNDDMIVANSHWFYMTLRRMEKKKEAAKVVEPIIKDMNIIENMVYHKMCRFYNGELPLDSLKISKNKDFMDDAILYGLGNWSLYNDNDQAKAKEYFEELLENGTRMSFAYLAAESDYKRLFLSVE